MYDAPWFREPETVASLVSRRSPVYILMTPQNKGALCITTTDFNGENVSNILGCETGRTVYSEFQPVLHNLFLQDKNLEAHVREIKEQIEKDPSKLSDNDRQIVYNCYPFDYTEAGIAKALINAGGGSYYSEKKSETEKAEVKPQGKPKEEKKEEKPKEQDQQFKLEEYKAQLTQELPILIEVIKIGQEQEETRREEMRKLLEKGGLSELRENRELLPPKMETNAQQIRMILDCLKHGINSTTKDNKNISVDSTLTIRDIRNIESFLRNPNAKAMGISSNENYEKLAYQIQFERIKTEEGRANLTAAFNRRLTEVRAQENAQQRQSTQVTKPDDTDIYPPPELTVN